MLKEARKANEKEKYIRGLYIAAIFKLGSQYTTRSLKLDPNELIHGEDRFPTRSRDVLIRLPLVLRS